MRKRKKKVRNRCQHEILAPLIKQSRGKVFQQFQFPPRTVLPLFLAVVAACTGCALSEGQVFPVCPAKNTAQQNARAKLSGNRLPSVADIAAQASSPDAQVKMQSSLDDYLYRWFYGPGVGETTLNVGTAVVFPPYILYLLANAGLGLSGYEPISVTSYIPGPPGDYVRAGYSTVTGVPGRATSGIAGEPFQGEEPCIP